MSFEISTTPLIIIHYGDVDYLRYTLKNATQINHETPVILIGDQFNKKYEKYGLLHFSFDEYIDQEYLNKFNDVYRLIGGSKFLEINNSKGGPYWTRFNFLKWRVLLNFCLKHNIERFWTFDSDVLYIKPLISLEERFSRFDYSTLNDNLVMQGLVNNLSYLELYTQEVLSVFNNIDYINQIQAVDFKQNPYWGLTMMRVFKILHEKYSPNTHDLKYTIEDVCFDPNISQPIDEIRTILNKKQLFINREGIFQKSRIDGSLKNLFGINMSWVPLYLLRNVAQQIHNLNRGNIKSEKLKPISFLPSTYDKFRRFLRKFPEKIDYELSKHKSKAD